jgi:hypothetical protein
MVKCRVERFDADTGTMIDENTKKRAIVRVIILYIRDSAGSTPIENHAPSDVSIPHKIHKNRRIYQSERMVREYRGRLLLLRINVYTGGG